MIGQAFSGFAYMNGFPDKDPVIAKPWTNDYISAMHTLFAAMAGVFHAKRTGQGCVMDVAQFESNARWLSHAFTHYTENGVISERAGNKAAVAQPYDVFHAKDKMVVIGAFGPAVYNRFIQAVGFDKEYFNWKDCTSTPQAIASEKGLELDAKIREWVAERSADEVFKQMLKFKVPCGVVNNAEDCVNDPHLLLEMTLLSMEDQTITKTHKSLWRNSKCTVPRSDWRGARLRQERSNSPNFWGEP